MSITERLRKSAALVTDLRERIAGLEADLREEQDRRQAMRNEWAAEVAALTERINALRSDRDCEKRLRKDAEDAREDATERVAQLSAELRVSKLRAQSAESLAGIVTTKPSGELGVGFSGGHCQTTEINYEPPTPLDWSDSTEGEKS